jgi:hypothetical protein
MRNGVIERLSRGSSSAAGTVVVYHTVVTNTPQPPRVPDRTELVVRFGCGAIVGLLCGLFVGVGLLFVFPGIWSFVVIAIVLGTPVLYGMLAMKLGDRFWWDIRQWLPPF